MLGDILIIFLIIWIVTRFAGSPTSGYRTFGGGIGYDAVGVLLFILVVLAFLKVFGTGLVY